MKKKLLSIAMVLVMVLCVLTISSLAASATAIPISSTVLVNDENIIFDAYNIGGNNYFKLRDLAYTLNGTAKQFDVDWDGANNAISLISGESYTAVGGEMTGKGSESKNAALTTAKVYVDGEEVAFTAYHIEGNNYFKLNDIGTAFNFSVFLEGAGNMIVIDTSKDFTPDDGTVSVTTALGEVKGTYEKTYYGIDVMSFKGVPFATVSDRFSEPEVTTAKYSGTLDCTEFGLMAPQIFDWGPVSGIAAAVDDPKSLFDEFDCLNLNIWTEDVNASMPVYVWFHGGGNAFGSGREGDYNMAHVAAKGIVGVTINYRMNFLGWSTFEDNNGLISNMGLLDCIAALKWVQANIADYGGDPTNVVVGGQSAGAVNVGYLILSPLAKGLFRGAIMESGAGLATPSDITIAQTNGLAGIIAGKDSVDSSEALKILSNVNPFDGSNAWGFGSGLATGTRDGSILPTDPLRALLENNTNHVDILYGYNRDEHTLIAPGVSDMSTLNEYLAGRFGADNVSAVKEYFNITATSTEEDIIKLANHIADLGFAYDAYLFTDALSASNNVYFYHYNFVTPNYVMGEGIVYSGEEFGAAHGGEIKLIYKNSIDLLGMDDAGYLFAEALTSSWLNFIKTGDPNGTNVSFTWPSYSAANREVLHLNGADTQVVGVPDEVDIAFILKLLYNYDF